MKVARPWIPVSHVRMPHHVCLSEVISYPVYRRKSSHINKGQYLMPYYCGEGVRADLRLITWVPVCCTFPGGATARARRKGSRWKDAQENRLCMVSHREPAKHMQAHPSLLLLPYLCAKCQLQSRRTGESHKARERAVAKTTGSRRRRGRASRSRQSAPSTHKDQEEGGREEAREGKAREGGNRRRRGVKPGGVAVFVAAARQTQW